MTTTDELRDKLRYVREMMETTGWQLLLRDWKEDEEGIKARLIYSTKNMEETQFSRGALSVLARLTNLAEVCDVAEQSLDNPPEE